MNPLRSSQTNQKFSFQLPNQIQKFFVDKIERKNSDRHVQAFEDDVI